MSMKDPELNIPPHGSPSLLSIGSNVQVSWMQETMNNHYRLIQQKRDALLKEKFTEKGFGHLLEGIAKRKFPKIMCIVQDEWSYYYADNDTDEGAFIVALRDNFSHGFTELEFQYQLTYEIQWQDKLPIISYKPFTDYAAHTAIKK